MTNLIDILTYIIPLSIRKDWLLSKRNFFDAEEKRTEALEEEYEKNGTHPSKRFYEPYEDKPSRNPTAWGCYCITYIIDLDGLMFTVEDYFAKFRLRNIPRGDDGKLWLEYLTMDAFGNYVLVPETPQKYCVRFCGEDAEPVSEKDLNLYRTFADDVKIIDESIWMSQALGQTFSPTYIIASTITKALMMAHNHKFREECYRTLTPGEDTFYQIAEILLRAASPAGVSLSQTLSVENPSYSCYLGGFDGKFYKYRGCTILITKDCSNYERLKANTGLAVAHAQETGTDISTVIIFSIWHVAVVIISGAVSGKLRVSRSSLYPFLAKFGFEELDKALSLLAQYLRPHCVDGSFSKWDASGGGLSGRINQSLPYDVLVQIMRLVDFKTYDAFALVSKSMRKEWFLRPRICNYTISCVKSADVQLYRYFPRCTLQATREEDGESVTLHLFYEIPCVYKGFKDGDDYCECHGQLCCPCPNPCEKKYCRKPVGLRMPNLREARRLEKQSTAEFMVMNYRLGRGKEGGDYFSRTFRPGLSILDTSRCCERCMSVEVTGREPTSVAEKCLYKCMEDN